MRVKEGEGESKGVTDRFLPFSLYPIQIFMQTIQTSISEYQLKTLNKIPFNTHTRTHAQQCNTKSPKEVFNALKITVHIAKLIFFPVLYPVLLKYKPNLCQSLGYHLLKGLYCVDILMICPPSFTHPLRLGTFSLIIVHNKRGIIHHIVSVRSGQ